MTNKTPYTIKDRIDEARSLLLAEKFVVLSEAEPGIQIKVVRPYSGQQVVTFRAEAVTKPNFVSATVGVPKACLSELDFDELADVLAEKLTAKMMVEMRASIRALLPLYVDVSK